MERTENEDKLINMLSNLCDDLHVLEIKVNDDEQFKIQIQCKLLGGGNSDEKCDGWVEEFSYLTNTNWITSRRFPNACRYEFRKLFACQHSSVNKTAVRKRQDCKIRNKKCKATIDFKFKKINRCTIKNDFLLKDAINVIVTIDFTHSHKVNVAEAFGYLRVSQKTKEVFESYFASGMSPSASRIYHEMKIIESEITEVSNVNTVRLLANSRENPTERQVKYLFEKWRLTQYGSREENSMIDVLKKKMISLKEVEVQLLIKENPFIVVIITPVMRRSFVQNLANEMVFVDSSGSCDQSNTCVTFIFSSNKTGAIPVACILHTAQTEANYTLAFTAAKEAIEVDNKKFSPKVFMTDDSAAERNALATVFPNFVLLLCIFHLCQALWRWLWQSEHNIKKEDRRTVMEMFRNILYAPTIEDADEHFNILISSSVVQVNKLLLRHMENLWIRRKEWCISYRNTIITRGNNTNNYTEASIRIFKDIVLQRCKVFNSCALIDFIANVFENYYKRKLLEFANSRRSKPQIDYGNICRRAKEVGTIYKISEKLFHIASENDPKLFYTINTEIAFCDCPSGVSGKFCKHLCAIEQKFGVLFKTSPNLSVADRIQLAKLAVGESAPEEFYENMEETINDSNEMASSNITTTSSQEYETETVVNLNKDDEEGLLRYKEEVTKLRAEFDRLANTLEENNSPHTTLSLIKFSKVLQNLKTPLQIINFMETKTRLCGRKSNKIKVQPTSISRRKNRSLPQTGRIQAGRPSNQEILKRQHNLSKNILANRPNAKLH